jgi:hypothetical protein
MSTEPKYDSGVYVAFWCIVLFVIALGVGVGYLLL